MNSIITTLITILIVLVIAKFLLNLNLKKIIGIAINSVIGFLILYLINTTGLVNVPLNLVTSILTGIFGIPGVIVIVLLALFGII